MKNIDVTSIEIRDYAISKGWKLIKEALKDGLFVLNSPREDYTQLIFPKDESSQNYQELAWITLKRLSEIYKGSFSKIEEEIREVNDDVISLRYYSDKKNVNYISFEEALDSIEATRQLLLSAASSVVNPSLYHPKLNRSEPQDLIKKTRFRHTEEGSFILKISCPFELMGNPQPSLFPDQSQIEKPLSRKSFELINSSSLMILEAIDADIINTFYEQESQKQNPLISYNFCDSLSKLFDEERELPFQLIFNWSRASLMKVPQPTMPNIVSFPFSTKSKIDEVKEYFAPKKLDLSGTFYGTVDTLDGTIGEDGMRSGTVILSILYENELIKARVNLLSKFYEVAVDAHKKQGGAYVLVKGDMKRGKRTNTIENLIDFRLSE